MQHRRDQQKVGRADDDLAERQPERRQRQLEAVDAERPAHDRGEPEVDRDPSRSMSPSATMALGLTPNSEATRRGPLSAEIPAAVHSPSSTVRPQKRMIRRDVARRQAPGGIEPIAHRAAAEGGKTHDVPDRQRDERGERDLAVRQVAAGVADRQRLGAGEAEKAPRRERGAERQMARRDQAQRATDLAQAVGAQRAPDQERREREDRRAEPGPQAPEPGRRGAHR